MNVSINPSYFCNFRCDFCYLTPEQLSDTKKISLDRLDEMLLEISKHSSIDWIDLYGGEIGALKKDYFYGLRDTIRNHYSDKINIITNFSMLHEGFFEDDFYLSVSYDFEAREKSEKVWQHLMSSQVPVALLILASSKVLETDVDYMINMINSCSAIESVEIKPYSTNQANAHAVSHRDFEQHVIKWLTSPVSKKFEFVNELRIQDSLSKTYNAFSNDHVYITPNGKFAVLDFDLNDREMFTELDTFEEYLNWAKNEKTQYISPICKSCDYYGNCLTEHYRYVKDLNNGCNGYQYLLNFYKNERLEN
jgi:sulfatase maturation enzyme AslB (radical SAM superfamily)